MGFVAAVGLLLIAGVRTLLWGVAARARGDRVLARWHPHAERVDAGVRVEVCLITPRGLLLRSDHVAVVAHGRDAGLTLAWEQACRRADKLNLAGGHP